MRSTNTSWARQRVFSPAEMVADSIVHVVGLVTALVAGSLLLVIASQHTAPEAVPALSVYVATLVTVLTCSLTFNLWPGASPLKHFFARLDQAAIFLFIAGTYTPFLAIIGGTLAGTIMMTLVWAASLVGVALKLIVPERFGRVAILLYLSIGWSGVLIFHSLASSLPNGTMWLVLAGGVVYSLGIIFHLWEKLRFQNALWHTFVVLGASLHLVAILHCMVFSRL